MTKIYRCILCLEESTALTEHYGCLTRGSHSLQTIPALGYLIPSWIPTRDMLPWLCFLYKKSDTGGVYWVPNAMY